MLLREQHSPWNQGSQLCHHLWFSPFMVCASDQLLRAVNYTPQCLSHLNCSLHSHCHYLLRLSYDIASHLDSWNNPFLALNLRLLTTPYITHWQRIHPCSDLSPLYVSTSCSLISSAGHWCHFPVWCQNTLPVFILATALLTFSAQPDFGFASFSQPFTAHFPAFFYPIAAACKASSPLLCLSEFYLIQASLIHHLFQDSSTPT